MKRFTTIVILFFLLSCGFKQDDSGKLPGDAEIQAQKDSVNILLNNYHKAAADAKFDNYFNCFDTDAIFTGTDATERWDKKSFMEWSKPYFDKGKAWSFTALQRNIYLSPDGKMAWFDELLDTQMKICRGSGVLVHTPLGWKIKQYILSMTIPNSQLKGILLLKSHEEDSVMATIKNK